MPSEDKPYEPEQPLRDILNSIEIVARFTDGMSFEHFLLDLKTRLAVERLLQIITEAAYRLGNQAATICPGPDWKGLRGMGNILRHAYHRLDNRVLWAVLTEDLPVLNQAAAETLKRLALPAGSKADLPTD